MIVISLSVVLIFHLHIPRRKKTREKKKKKSKIQRNGGREREVKRNTDTFSTFFTFLLFSLALSFHLWDGVPCFPHFPYPSPISHIPVPMDIRQTSGENLADIRHTSGGHSSDIRQTIRRTSCGYPFVPRRDFGLGFDCDILDRDMGCWIWDWDIGYGNGRKSSFEPKTEKGYP